jgi:hypothetical protein
MAWGWGSWIGGRSRCGTNREQFIINQTSAYYTTAGSFIECPKTHFVPASTKDSLCPIRTCILGRKLKPRMNFQEPEYVLNEPWWVTVIGCMTLAAMFAFALIAV